MIHTRRNFIIFSKFSSNEICNYKRFSTSQTAPQQALDATHLNSTLIPPLKCVLPHSNSQQVKLPHNMTTQTWTKIKAQTITIAPKHVNRSGQGKLVSGQKFNTLISSDL